MEREAVVDHLLRNAVRVLPLSRHVGQQRIEESVGVEIRHGFFDQLGLEDLHQFDPRLFTAVPGEVSLLVDVLLVPVHGFQEFHRPLVGRSDGGEDGRLPLPLLEVPHRDHRLDLSLRLVGSVPVRLVDDEDVGDLENPRLDRLDVVPKPRNDEHEIGVRNLDDLHLVLPDADRLDEDDVLPHRVHDVHDVDGGAGKPPEVPPGGEALDENALVERVLLHPDPVAEDGAAGIRARRVDRDDPDRLPALPQVRGDPVDEGRLPGARRPRHAEDVGAPRVPVQCLQGEDRRRDLIVQVPHQPRRGPGVSGEDLPSGGVHGGQ